MQYIKNIFRFCLQLFESPLSAGIFSFMIYAVIAAQRGPITGVSTAPYFNYLTDAFLHGQLSLHVIPPNQHDLAFFNGQYYMYWSPFPAIVLMPFIALFGLGFSDVLFTLFIGALNVSLVAFTLRMLDKKELVLIDPEMRGLLTIFFAFGTVHLFLSSLGNVWFTSQVIAFLCCVLVCLAAVGLKGYPAFFLTGLALACAILTRNHLVFLGIWPAYYLFQSHKSLPIKKLALHFAAAAIPIVTAVFLVAAYNQLRFGNIFEYGLTYQDFGKFFQPDFDTYGHFNVHYLQTNFFYNFIFYPFPTSEETLMGGSLFLLSPLFFAGFWALFNSRYRSSAIVLWLTILAVTLPILLNIGTGWKTFGPRYTLDFTMPLLFLTAIGMNKWPKWLSSLLVVISIVHYVIGTLYFTMSHNTQHAAHRSTGGMAAGPIPNTSYDGKGG
jgi:hypothetical protein